MNLCGKLLTEREGKSIGLAFFLVVAIKSNLSTFAGAKVQNKSERDTSFGFIFFSIVIRIYLIIIFCVFTFSPLMRRNT